MISLISLRGVSSGHFLPGVGVNVTKNTCRGCRVKPKNFDDLRNQDRKEELEDEQFDE